MDSIIITWRELLLVLAAVLAVYVAEMLLLLRRRGNPGWRLWQRGAQANAQSRALADLRAQVEALRMELAQLRERAGVAPEAGTPPAQAPVAERPRRMLELPVEGVTPYAHAIRMAREGCPVAEVAGDCGISRGEAELIVALYRSSSTH